MGKNLNRETIARMFLKGKGIEIGALNNPLKVPAAARVKYVDRMSLKELEQEYPEMNPKTFARVDILDDGERLETIEDNSQDFVIANHFLEHCENPINAIENMLRALKNGGILYMSVPDKRFTFDSTRQITSFQHLMRDYREGPEVSRKDHYVEWMKVIHHARDKAEIEHEATRLMEGRYSIHFHVWTQTEVLEFLTSLKRMFPFEVVLCFCSEDEIIALLRKTEQLLDRDES